jgi:hypothetical protein
MNDKELFENLASGGDFLREWLKVINATLASREMRADADKAAKIAKDLPGLIAERDSVVREIETKRAELDGVNAAIHKAQMDWQAFQKKFA